MGVSDLWALVRKRAPGALRPVTPGPDHTGMHFVVDGTGYLHRFASTVGEHPDPEIRARAAVRRFHQFVDRLRGGGACLCTVVWDGPRKHPLKLETVHRRARAVARRTDALRARVSAAEAAAAGAADLASFVDTRRELAEARDSLARAELPPRGLMTDLAQAGPLGVVHMTADHDADFLIADLVRRAEGTAMVVSEDSDLLAMGCPELWRIDGGAGAGAAPAGTRFLRVDLGGVLEALGLDLDRFQVLCVLLGTDFCARVRGCGPVFCEALVRRAPSARAALDPAAWPAGYADRLAAVEFPARHLRVLAEFGGGGSGIKGDGHDRLGATPGAGPRAGPA